MAFTLLEVAGLTVDQVVSVLDKAVGNIISCVDEVKEQQHILANSGMHMRDYLLTTDRLQTLNEVQGLMKAAKELLRRV
jgi:hypothetical protein